MTFIKGAWIELRPWDERYHDYYCCPKQYLYQIAHKDKNHNPTDWITSHCTLSNNKEIPLTEEGLFELEVQRPTWCPLMVNE